MHSGDNKRKTVAVLFGGRSVEHEISIITGLQIIRAMDVVKFQSLPVYVAPDGKWYAGQELTERDLYKNMPASLQKVQEVVLLPTPGLGGLTVVRSRPASGFALFAKTEKQVLPVDVYFPAFHGTYGEDGCVQGLFELAGVTYTGCDVLSAAIGMSKYHAKKLMESHGIPVLPAMHALRDQLDAEGLAGLRNCILAQEKMQMPLFVKPASLGSSIGVAKAKDAAELDAALLNAFKFDTAVIVEPCLENKLEINVSVLDGAPLAVSVVEIPVPAAGAELTYEDKYLRGGGKKTGSAAEGMAGLTRVIDPADLSFEIKSRAQDYALRAFAAMGCAGVARIDFMLDLNDDRLYFNEINTLPGSLAFYLWEKANPPVLFTEMITRMIERAELCKARQAALSRDVGFQALFK